MYYILVVLVFNLLLSSNALRLHQIDEQTARQFDIILYGATGFTGKLAVQYLRNHPEKPKWAIAGRNITTLKALHKEMELESNVDFLVAPLSDKMALQAMTNRARVVISAAGPFSESHGENLIRSCIDSGTHYADLAGETFWQQMVVRELHRPAKEAGIKIVLGAGFASEPSDLASFLSTLRLRGSPAKVKVVYTKFNGWISGGTMASSKAAEKDTAFQRSINQKPAAEDPYALAPDFPAELRIDTHPSNIHEAHFDSDLKQVVEPCSWGSMNAAVVRRSISLLYPTASCSYSEGRTHSSTIEQYALMNRTGVAPINLEPKQGEGPPDWMLKHGSFMLQANAVGHHGNRAIAKITGRGDPGYSASSKMLVETGLGLLHSQVQRYGVLTPSTALGMELVNRLQALEDGMFMQFEISQE